MPTIHGRTRAHYDNPHRHQTLAGATLYFYRADAADSRPPGPGRSRLGWRALDALPPGALGLATVQPDGSYSLDLEGYEGGPLLFALRVEKLDYAPATGKSAQGLLGVAQPRREGLAWVLDLDVPRPAYCALLGALDLWLVAGRVTDGSPLARPLVEGVVTACARDFDPDGTLGQAATDATGSFEVFFPGDVFRHIPTLPPPFDSILPHELIGGPDLYFKVRSGNAWVVDEPPSRARERDRENRRNCSYLELCAEPPRLDTMTLWTHVGETGLGRLDGAGDWSGDVQFRGTLARTYQGEPVRFRFVHAAWADTAPRYPRDYRPLTAEHLHGGQAYAYLREQVGPAAGDCMLTPVFPLPDAEGWIAIPQDPRLIHLGRLIGLRPESLAPRPGCGAEPRLPSGKQLWRRKVSFILEVRTERHVLHPQGPVTLVLEGLAAPAHEDGQTCHPGC
ncbi:hypothetical protein [Pyxidicoccus trucidator]|uniref:hypothetical protein n=1 Tax=Pyxidicoccus trucidator TaxID=2709662 RepID=UPI0013DC3013|nr:hypothetical protein [Pyxidicoccus trucidator]